MEKVKIKYLAFSSYVEMCGTACFAFGIVTAILTLVMMFFNMVNLTIRFAGNSIILCVAIPFTYAISGILIGVITYIPYKLLMKLRKGAILNYIHE